MLVFESIKRIMGWCPMESPGITQVQKQCSSHGQCTNAHPIQSNSAPVRNMSVPLQMIDWRILTILIGLSLLFLIFSLPDHLNRTLTTYLLEVLITTVLITTFFLFDHSKITVDSEMLLIKPPLLKALKIPLGEVESATIVDNTMCKLKKLYYILAVVTLVFLFIKITKDYAMLSSMGFADVPNIATIVITYFFFTFIFYRWYRRSRYPKSIIIHAENKDITLFPRNSAEFHLLKDKLMR
ncbi:DUF1673 family protein [Methanococcoides sp. SA1]|nr:DUF1673 family protein [Methanococcoides sp. SA1]